jgi:hypothetical protein
MPYQVWQLVDSITTAAGRLHREQWVMLSIIVLVVGMICMRGFGSRSNY